MPRAASSGPRPHSARPTDLTRPTSTVADPKQRRGRNGRTNDGPIRYDGENRPGKIDPTPKMLARLDDEQSFPALGSSAKPADQFLAAPARTTSYAVALASTNEASSKDIDQGK